MTCQALNPLQHARQQAPQGCLVLGGERPDSRRSLEHSIHLLVHAAAFRRERDLLHSPVAGAHPAFDQAAARQVIDDSRHVGGVTMQAAGDLVHRERRSELAH